MTPEQQLAAYQQEQCPEGCGKGLPVEHGLHEMGTADGEVAFKCKCSPAEAFAELAAKVERLDQVCAEILEIMNDYHEQEESPRGVDTPGGLEHMGDVWRLFRKWEGMLSDKEAKPDAR